MLWFIYAVVYICYGLNMLWYICCGLYMLWFIYNILARPSRVCLFCCFCILYFSNEGEVEDYIKCELIGGGYPRHLNTFSNLFIVAVLNNISTCYAVAIVDLHPCRVI